MLCHGCLLRFVVDLKTRGPRFDTGRQTTFIGRCSRITLVVDERINNKETNYSDLQEAVEELCVGLQSKVSLNPARRSGWIIRAGWDREVIHQLLLGIATPDGWYARAVAGCQNFFRVRALSSFHIYSSLLTFFLCVLPA